MRPENDNADAEPKTPPCQRCGDPFRHGVTWGVSLCKECTSDWRDAAPTHGDIIAKYGSDDDSVRIYSDFTKRWMETRRLKGRAKP